MKALDKVGEFEDFEEAKSKAHNIISELGWEYVIINKNYFRARAWNNFGQAVMVTLIFTPDNELLINALGDDSGTFQRFRSGLHTSISDNLEAFEKRWKSE
ncbi:MAG: hypothetical protein RLN90_01280 [Balneolaceae bacterium]